MQISTMMEYDAVKIVATWFYSIEARFQCDKQKAEITARIPGQATIRIKALEERNGCNDNRPISGIVENTTLAPRYQWQNMRFYRCFCTFVDYSTNALFFYHTQYKRGILPFAGALADQPAKVIEAFNLIDVLQEEKRLELEEKARKHERLSNGRR